MIVFDFGMSSVTSVSFFHKDAPGVWELSFMDIGNIWGVDYSSSLSDGSKIRSSVGLGINLFTPIGPLNFTFSEVLTKSNTDIAESFRFNLGTTF